MNETARDPVAALRIDRSEETSSRGGSRRMWKIGLTVLALLLIGGGGFFYLAARSNAGGNGQKGSWLSNLTLPDVLKSRPEVRATRVSVETGRSADATVVATGYLESRRQAKIGARAPGRIEIVNVEEGSAVKKDEVLAVLEHADLDASLAATKASLARSRTAIGEQQVQIDQAKREFDRMTGLKKSGSVSDSEFDSAKFQHDSAIARMASLTAEVELAEARLREAEQLKENMFIRAPFDGTVISKDAEVGESILPGGMGEASGRGSVVTIADLEHLEVECDVKEDYISRIHSGQASEVAVDAVPDRKYQGVVRKVIPMGDRARATIKVKVAITNADERLFPDMSATVYFLPLADANAKASEIPRMFCPASAVESTDQGNRVWVIDAESHVQPILVKIGPAKDGRVEILSGLEGNERVVVEPKDLQANQAVKLAD